MYFHVYYMEEKLTTMYLIYKTVVSEWEKEKDRRAGEEGKKGEERWVRLNHFQFSMKLYIQGSSYHCSF